MHTFNLDQLLAFSSCTFGCIQHQCCRNWCCKVMPHSMPAAVQHMRCNHHQCFAIFWRH